jgi:hypothetical protein
MKQPSVVFILLVWIQYNFSHIIIRNDVVAVLVLVTLSCSTSSTIGHAIESSSSSSLPYLKDDPRSSRTNSHSNANRTVSSQRQQQQHTHEWFHDLLNLPSDGKVICLLTRSLSIIHLSLHLFIPYFF